MMSHLNEDVFAFFIVLAIEVDNGVGIGSRLPAKKSSVVHNLPSDIE